MRTDENDLIGFQYNNETYYYKKNYQGDILGIYNSNYELECTYEYDSYGSIVSIKDVLGTEIEDENHIGNINPYRYRSYYYDKETKLYYLNSRYYNPLWGRFINADGIIGTSESYLGYNLYAYCENNPITNIDHTGYFINILKNVSQRVKNTCAALGSAIGKIFNRPVAGDMLAKSFKPNDNLSQKTKTKLSESLRNSNQIKQTINNAINDFKTNKNTYYQESVEFTRLSDLHLAVGKATVTVRIVQIDNNHWADITISDVYDFDKKNGFSIGNVLNNMGTYFQNQGLITPYEWDVNYAILVE